MTRAQSIELRELLELAERAGCPPGLAATIRSKLFEVRCETPEPIDSCSCLACDMLRAHQLESDQTEAERSRQAEAPTHLRALP